MILRNKSFRILSMAAAMAMLAACGGQESSGSVPSEPLLGDLGGDYSTDFVNAEGDTVGTVAIVDGPNGALFKVDLEGLSKGWHGIHLHQVGDCSDGADGFKASGSHINPDGNEHGLLNANGYERADMPNIYAGNDGRATASFFNSYVRVTPGEEAAAVVGAGAILMDADGFAMVVHESPDDHMTQPIGGAGARVACAAFSR
ncbi:superoxide dismutase family protein [Parvularcula flava]|uniref:Superoxide dismutase [Cu-Zn] n=1 Tax=Aquisalinus luteolus TaxID=1566827 RepID=A0A8J3A5U6_9PROT|nr:superoxide dismutase family protein [Aquisalinus luteolus]NHK27489.1 superoxide dismutase family protein [Aquisalinus luteolus]GGH95592.1 superoxide dismutase [Cu-Zn] [Aquisalinus luteolus]